MIAFFTTILVLIVLDYLAETFLGKKGIGSVFSIRNKWIEFCNTTRGFEIAFGWKKPDGYFEEGDHVGNYYFHLEMFRLSFYLYLPIKHKPKKDGRIMFGFYSVDGEFPTQMIYSFGSTNYNFTDLPNALDFEVHRIFNINTNQWDNKKEIPDDIWYSKDGVPECYRLIDGKNLTYKTKSGKFQITDAIAYISQRRWRRKIFKWLRIPIYYTRTDLEMQFSDDIGDKKGTWKGGVYGCGIDINQYVKDLKIGKDGETHNIETSLYAIKNRFHNFMINDQKY